MEGVRWWLVLGVLAGVGGEKWRWPEDRSATLKIDTKVRLIDDFRSLKKNEIDSQNEEGNFREALDTTGFYNRPQDEGRYPVKVDSPLFDNGIKYKKTDLIQPGHVDLHRHSADASMDFVRYCKCLDSAECRRNNYEAVRSCSNGKTLCCYLQANKQLGKATEYFNEGDEERPDLLLPGRSHPSGPFPPPPQYDDAAAIAHQSPVIVATGNDRSRASVLSGPGGPTGVVGPIDEFGHSKNRPLLSEHDNPVGLVGPTHIHHNKMPGHHNHAALHEPHESAQRGILVGPEGPTGLLGPPAYSRQPLLVGPGGPTGLIGPSNYRSQQSRYYSPGILTGPRGPTGIVGPGQQVLVGPGGPTGRIGPPNRSTFFN